MGITGVEGVFRRCCEETLKVIFLFAFLNRPHTGGQPLNAPSLSSALCQLTRTQSSKTKSSVNFTRFYEHNSPAC
jgi:hypothetical protein